MSTQFTEFGQIQNTHNHVHVNRLTIYMLYIEYVELNQMSKSAILG